jgi:hypothetical protein
MLRILEKFHEGSLTGSWLQMWLKKPTKKSPSTLGSSDFDYSLETQYALSNSSIPQKRCFAISLNISFSGKFFSPFAKLRVLHLFETSVRHKNIL